MDLERLKDKHKDQDCLILTCGPSLNDFSQPDIDRISADKVVLSLKQAFLKFSQVTDYHFLNSANFYPYEYLVHRPIVIGELAYNEQSWEHIFNRACDILFRVKNNTDFSQSLLVRKNFDDWTFDKSHDRPWGPGLMYETVLFFADYLGVKNIYTIGWDMGPVGSVVRDHFYKPTNIINPANPLEVEETHVEVETSEYWYKWLKSRGRNLYVASKGSYVHESVPRIEL